MKIYKTQSAIEKDIIDGVLAINESVKFECSFSIKAKIIVHGDINAKNINAKNINAKNINAKNINAWNIKAWNINAKDINAWNIKAWNIKAGDINAGDIKAGDINAGDINAGDINAGDINAGDINAGDILYYAFCCAYNSITCLSIKAKRENHQKPVCLDGELKFKEKTHKITIDNKKIELSEESFNQFKKQFK